MPEKRSTMEEIFKNELFQKASPEVQRQFLSERFPQFGQARPEIQRQFIREKAEEIESRRGFAPFTAIKEDFLASKALGEAAMRPAEGFEPLNPLRGPQLALGIAGAVLSPLAPAFRFLGNVGMTGVSAAQAIGSRPGEAEYDQLSENISRVMNLVDERPTTGSWLTDFLGEVAGTFLPIGQAAAAVRGIRQAKSLKKALGEVDEIAPVWNRLSKEDQLKFTQGASKRQLDELQKHLDTQLELAERFTSRDARASSGALDLQEIIPPVGQRPYPAQPPPRLIMPVESEPLSIPRATVQVTERRAPIPSTTPPTIERFVPQAAPPPALVQPMLRLEEAQRLAGVAGATPQQRGVLTRRLNELRREWRKTNPSGSDEDFGAFLRGFRVERRPPVATGTEPPLAPQRPHVDFEPVILKPSTAADPVLRASETRVAGRTALLDRWNKLNRKTKDKFLSAATQEEAAEILSKSASMRKPDAVDMLRGVKRESLQKIEGAFDFLERKHGTRADLAARASKKTGRKPDDELTQYGAIVRSRGMDDFEPWSEHMTKRFGEDIRNQLAAVWPRTKDLAKDYKEKAARLADFARNSDEAAALIENPLSVADATLAARLARLGLVDEEITYATRIVSEHKGWLQHRRMGTDWLKTENAARELVETGRVVLGLPRGTALNAEGTEGLKMLVGGLIRRSWDASSELAAATAAGAKPTPQQLANVVQKYQAALMGMKSYMGVGSEAGRALNIHKKVSTAMETGFTPEIQKALKSVLGNKGERQIQKIAENLSKFNPDDIAGQLRYIWTLDDPSKWKWLQHLYFTNILSGPMTHIRNTVGNTFNISYDLLTHPAKAGADWTVARMLGRERQVLLGEWPHQFVGAMAGLEHGIKRGWHLFRHGVRLADEPGKLDFPIREMPSIAGIPAGAVNVVGRALEAMDTVFRSARLMSVQYGMAYTKATNLARARKLPSGTSAQDEMTRLIMNPTEDMLEAMEILSRRTTFQESPGAITKWLISAKRAAGDKSLILDIVAPFLKTPGNILKQGFEASPVGFFMKVPGGKQRLVSLRRGEGERLGLQLAEGRLAAEATGRAAAGSLASLPLVSLALEGRLTGRGPSDPNQLRHLQDTGWKRDSIKLPGSWFGVNMQWLLDQWPEASRAADGDYYIPYYLMQPLNVQSFIIANIFERGLYDKRIPKSEALMQGFVRSGQSFMDQSYLQGVSALFEALNDENVAPNWFANSILSWVPLSGAVRQLTNVLNPEYKLPADLKDRISQRLPWQAQTVLPRLDRWGNEIMRPRTIPFVGPTAGARENTVRDELDRLEIFLGMPGVSVEMDPERDITPEEQWFMTLLKGRLRFNDLRRVVENPRYQEIENDDIRRRIFDRAKDFSSRRFSPHIKASLPTPPRGLTDAEYVDWYETYHKALNRELRPDFTDLRKRAVVRDMVENDPVQALKWFRERTARAAVEANRLYP